METSVHSTFDKGNLKSDLKRRSVRGGAATMLGQCIRFVVQTTSTIILARLLTPADFGLIAMVTAVTGFAALFKDLGLSMATVQKAEVSHEQITTLFWVNVGVSVLIALVVASLASTIAWFYNEPRLTMITIVLSVVFLFGGLTIQHQALLQRQMRFMALASIQVISVIAGVAAAIVSATLGVGYWALVTMQIIAAFANALGVWLLCDWHPGLPVRHSGVRSMLLFGRDVTGFNLINFFYRNLDNILIGRCWGAGSLGLYDRAYKLMMFPIQQIRIPLVKVGLPALSSLQNEPERARNYYRKLLFLVSFFSMPLIVVIIVYSKPIILMLLGKEWIGASNIFKLLGIAAFIEPVSSTRGLVMVSFGQTKRYLIVGVINASGAIIAFSVGIFWGPTGIAIAYAVANYVLLLPLILYSFRKTPISALLFFSEIWLPALASSIMGLVLYVMSQKMQYGSTFSEFFISLIVSIIIYLMINLFLGGRQKLLECCYYPLLLIFKNS